MLAKILNAFQSPTIGCKHILMAKKHQKNYFTCKHKSMKIKILRLIKMVSRFTIYGIFLQTITFSVLLASPGKAQKKSVKEVFVNIESRYRSLDEVFKSIEDQTDYRFVYTKNIVTNTKGLITEKGKRKVYDVLFEISQKRRLKFTQLNNSISVEKNHPRKGRNRGLVDIVASINISGKVTNQDDGEGLPGANVMVKGTTIGTVTDVDGNYTLTVPDQNVVLIFSSVGFIQEEVTVGNRTVINLSLVPDIQALEEIVVIGYGTKKRSDLTGSLVSVGNEDFDKQPLTRVDQALQGRAAGVSVTQTSGEPGAGFKIRIRGANSISGSNEPLYVVDGLVVGDILSLNVNDIKSLEILKDASATAIYGSRGANGVALITTKGGKAGKTSIDINVSQGAGKVTRMMDLLNTQQYLEMRNEAFNNDGATPNPNSPNDLDVLEWGDRYTDWQDELIGGTAHMTNAEVSMSGGDASTRFSVGIGFKRETTPLRGDFAYQKGSGRFALNHSTLDRKFNIALTTSYTADENDLANSDPTSLAITLAPNAPSLLNEDGSLNFENPLGQPLGRLKTQYIVRTRNLITSANLSYKPVSFLNIKTRLGFNRLSFDETRTTPIAAFNPASGVTSGSSDFTDGGTSSWIIEPQIEYRKELAQGKLSILVGTTLQETIGERQTIRATGFQDDSSLENIEAAGSIDNLEYNYNQYRYNAIFGRINYNWNEKYIINLTGRRDGSSRFGPDKQFGNFGAVGIAWIFSNEGFVKNSLSFISFGKLRGSYGLTGNDQILDYEYLNSYEYTGDAYLGVPGIQPARIANPEYGWETNKKFEAALELGLYDDRVFITASYYRNRSSNQLVGFDLPGTTGFLSVRDNLPAVVENTGWELELSTTNIEKNNFGWTTSINFTAPKNKLVAYPNIENSPFATRFRVGSSLFVRGAFDASVDPQTGIYTYRDVNDDGFAPSFSDDLLFDHEIGTEFFGGFQNTFRYKDFELDILFQFVKQTARSYIFDFSPQGWHGNQPTAVLDRWQQPGDVTDVQMFTQGFTDAVFAWFDVGDSDLNFVDASFVRLENVSLSWNLPDELNDKLKLERSRIYLQGQNLLTFTDYVGLDPESFGTSVPPLRMVTGGIQVTF